MAQYAPGERVSAPQTPDRGQRGAWKRVTRSLRELDVDPPGAAPGRELGDHGPDLGLE